MCYLKQSHEHSNSLTIGQRGKLKFAWIDGTCDVTLDYIVHHNW